MIQPDLWMKELTEKLKVLFEDRLTFVGLQGSYQRNEAHEESDIDAVVILETLTIQDIKAYRELLSTMPEGEKSCGFLSGRQELKSWPKHELFQFAQDTRTFYGDLNRLLPAVDRQDILQGAKISAANLYHACCHAAVHEADPLDALKGLYKGAFFLMQLVYYLRQGVYLHTKSELSQKLPGDEQEILTLSMNWTAHCDRVSENPDRYFDLLLRWTAQILDSSF